MDNEGESRRLVLNVTSDVLEAKALGRRFSRLLQMTFNGVRSVEVVNTSTGGSTFVESDPPKPIGRPKVGPPPKHCIDCKSFTLKHNVSNCLNPLNVKFVRASVLRRKKELCGPKALWFEEKARNENL